jgi:hypothetical protein
MDGSDGDGSSFHGDVEMDSLPDGNVSGEGANRTHASNELFDHRHAEALGKSSRPWKSFPSDLSSPGQ